MTDTQIEDLLQKIEDDFQDNLDGIVQLPTKDFSTEVLHELKKEWENRYQAFQTKIQWCNSIGFTAMISFVISLISFFLGFVALSKAFLVLFGFGVVSTIAGYSILFKKYGAGIKQRYVQKSIDKELSIRRKQ